MIEELIMNNLLNTSSALYPYPRWIVFQLLEKCNLRCKMCYEWGEQGSYFEKKDLEQLDIKAVKKVIEECHSVKPYFELFGGEPLLYPQVDEVLALIKHYGCDVDIPTNGTLLEKHADMLTEYEPKRIWVSIDGSEEVNDLQRGAGVYKKATSGLRKLYEKREEKGKKNPALGVTMVVTPLNYKTIEQFFLHELDLSILNWVSMEFQLYITESCYEKHSEVVKSEFGVEDALCARGLIRDVNDFIDIDIPELIRQVNNVRDYCQEKGINVIGYPKAMDYDNLSNFYTAKWDKMIDKRNRCSFPWLYVEISANGDVTPCHTFYDYTIGNIYKENILTMWNSDRLSKFRKFTKKNLLPVCTACSRYYSDL
jgi:radical SAM protein with 4Fe4S-binding SPASM domain